MFTKNEFEARIKANDDSIKESKIAEKLEEKYKPKPFSDESKPFYVLGYVFGSLLVIYTMGVSSLCVLEYIKLHIGETNGLVWGLVVIIVCSLIGGLEIAKIVNARKFARYRLFKKTNKMAAIGLVFFSSISIFLAYMGGSYVPAITNPVPEYKSPTLLDESAIEKKYNLMAEEIKTQKKDLIKVSPKWHGKFDTKILVQISKLDNDIIDLEKDKIEAINNARSVNEQKTIIAENKYTNLTNEHKSENMSLGFIFGLIAVIVECLSLVCSAYIEHYDYKCALERLILSTTTNSPSIEETPEPSIEETPEPSIEETPENVINDTHRVVVTGFKNPPAKMGGNPLYNDTKQNDDVVFVHTKTTFTHVKKNGSSVEMSKTEITSRINQYKKLVLGAKTKTQKMHYEKVLQYWIKALKSLKQ